MAEYGVKTTPSGVNGGTGMDHTHRPVTDTAHVAALDRRESLSGQMAPQGGTAGCPITPGY